MNAGTAPLGDSSTPLVIRGTLRDYDWGITNGLSDWTGESTDGPEAELWFGAHPAAPSPVVFGEAAGDDGATLADVLAPEQVPLLTKILAAASPLSLQVHPSADLAVRWRRTETGRDLLPDDVAKTEMLIALEEFVVLVGWRATAEVTAILTAIGADESVLAAVDEGRRTDTIGLLLDDHPVVADADAWLAALADLDVDETTVAALQRVAEKFPNDPGVAVAVLLQSQILQEGDAVYLPAGVPHAYVHGRGVEVMTNSDNVLRMGLTSKAISVDHAVSALNEDLSETIMRTPQDGTYAPAGAPFSVRFCSDETVTAPTGTFRLGLVLDGGMQARVGDRRLPVDVGDAVVMTADDPEGELEFLGRGVLVWANAAEE